MGSGNRFKFFFNPRFWALGVFYDNFPFDHIIGIVVGPFQLEIGFGRGYDEIDPTEQDY